MRLVVQQDGAEAGTSRHRAFCGQVGRHPDDDSRRIPLQAIEDVVALGAAIGQQAHRHFAVEPAFLRLQDVAQVRRILGGVFQPANKMPTSLST